MGEPSITLVSPWLGPLPRYLALFLGSVRANPSVRVVIPSDQPAPPGLPPNVRWLPMTLADFSARASAALGVPMSVEHGYKLCDFKPTYGAVFADEIGDAAFWGYCDLDLVFGDLRAFLTPDVLASGDLFSFRGPWWLSGALTLFRTDSAATRLFAEIPGWERMLATPRITGFDESAHRFDGAERAVADLVAAGEAVSLTDAAREAHAAGRLRLVTPEWIAEPSAYWAPFEYRWQEGRLTDLQTGRPCMFCHFVRLKNEPLFVVDAWPDSPPTYYLLPTGTTTIPPEDRMRRVAHGVHRRVRGLPGVVRRRVGQVRHRIGLGTHLSGPAKPSSGGR